MNPSCIPIPDQAGIFELNPTEETSYVLPTGAKFKRPGFVDLRNMSDFPGIINLASGETPAGASSFKLSPRGFQALLY